MFKMTSNNQIMETQAAVRQEIKELESKCAESLININNNMDREMKNINVDNIEEKASCYVDGLRAAIEESETPVVTDTNRITSEFLTELNDKILQVKELCAYERGVVRDISTEISRLNTLIKTAEEAKAKQKQHKVEILPKHIMKAKHAYKTMKSELHRLIHALFPNDADQLMEVLADLMQEKMAETSHGYMKVTPERFHLMEMLKDIGIVTPNPYNSQEVRLAF